ncbi:MAG TPA: formate dehydrogenase accessory sulfurtransferase FdhD [Proteobacteria bacterium]|nr:formate dehydrogenase accessory protein [bacterium BMS3Abin14]HDL52994.1 formate dehydrogenase accessory sulfurtransferase FdhD [Pseudomonadota bacterium]
MDGDPRQEIHDVLVIKGDEVLDDALPVVREVPMTIFLNGRELITLVTTGDANKELALGFLLSEGFIQSRDDLKSLRDDPEAGTVEVEVARDLSMVEELWERRTVTSGCGKGATFYSVLDSLHARPVTSELKITPRQVYHLMAELNRMSGLYRATRGVHNSALADEEGILLFRDDIGRHNAVDKIRGAAFLEEISLEDKVLITTGRMSSEIIIKVAKMGIPLLVSRSAPTSLALDLAKRVKMTLVGYVRGERMTVYTGGERVKG